MKQVNILKTIIFQQTMITLLDYSKILELINNLDFNHKTIGNFYLLKNSSYNEKIFKND